MRMLVLMLNKSPLPDVSGRFRNSVYSLGISSTSSYGSVVSLVSSYELITSAVRSIMTLSFIGCGTHLQWVIFDV